MRHKCGSRRKGCRTLVHIEDHVHTQGQKSKPLVRVVCVPVFCWYRVFLLAPSPSALILKFLCKSGVSQVLQLISREMKGSLGQKLLQLQSVFKESEMIDSFSDSECTCAGHRKKERKKERTFLW